jgi:hypothetical protein
VPGPLTPTDLTSGAGASITRLNAGLLLDDAPIETVAADLVGEPADEGSAVKVPLGVAVAIGVCLAVTVVFGIIPAPLIDFAHKATLLFLP